MVPPPTPLDLPALVALMYRAGWTTLSLSATLTVRTMHEPERPGGETSYRCCSTQAGNTASAWPPTPAGCSRSATARPPGSSCRGALGGRGERGGEAPGPPRRAVRRPAAGPGSPFEELLIPATLLSRYTLEPAGPR